MDEAQDEQHDPTLQAKEEMSVNDEQEVISDTTENDDVAKNLYDAEEFLANFSELRLENDQLKRTNDQLQIELEKAREELEQMVIDKSDLEAILRQERDHHKEELWKVRGDLQKIQEERLLWKEKYLDIYMKNGTSGSGINIDTSPSGKIRPGKRKQGTLNTENEQEFYSNLSTSFGLTNQDEQPAAVIILKKRTSFYSNGETRIDYSGIRHEVQINAITNSHYGNKNNDAEFSTEQTDFTLVSNKQNTQISISPCNRIVSGLLNRSPSKLETSTKPTTLVKRRTEVVESVANSAGRYPKRLRQHPTKFLNTDADNVTTEEKHSVTNIKRYGSVFDGKTTTKSTNSSDVLKYDKQNIEENRKYFSIDDKELEEFQKELEDSIQCVYFDGEDSKQYVCIVCHKSTHDRHVASTHATTHITLKPYRCSKCNGSFNTITKLNTHINIRHRNSRYKCHKCERRFISIGGRHKHMKRKKHRPTDP